MKLSSQSFLIFYNSFWLFSDSKQVDSILEQNHEFIGWQKESFDWWFPELITFMPVFNVCLPFTTLWPWVNMPMFRYWRTSVAAFDIGMQVYDENIVCVDTNALVADNNWFWTIFLIHYLHVTASNIQFVWPADEIVNWCLRIVAVNWHQEITKSAFLLVG